MHARNDETRVLSPERSEDLLRVLKIRFEKNMGRHSGLAWADVLSRLEADPSKLWSLSEMENTGGEPDVVWCEAETGAFLFVDCSPESPAGRRNLCYDRPALESRKANRPGGNAVDIADAMGVTLLTEEQYRSLQELGEFDAKTSSWIMTPVDVRSLGGALFADRRYGRVFVYHNSAPSYYGVRGFRAALSV